MTTEQINVAIRSAGPDDPLFVALMTLLDEQLVGETTTALMPSLTPEDRAYNCGRAASLTDLRSEILGIRGPVNDNG